jgi:F0F1-type ATP synthase assembly protein I
MNDEAQLGYNRAVAYRTGYAQLAVSAAIALALFFVLDFRAAYSALMGGVISGCGTLCLALVLFARAEMSPQQFVRALYVGEFIKIALTIGMFVAAINLVELNMLAFFLTYIVTLMANWIVLLVA